MPRREIRGVVFDKDGTLLDYHATWDTPFRALLDHYAAGDDSVFSLLCAELGFDRVRGKVADDSPFISDSNAGFAARLDRVLGRSAEGRDTEQEIEDVLDRVRAPAVPAPGADALLHRLHRAEVPMVIATNDSERRARQQVDGLGWGSYFRAILGYDSGHGEKPQPAIVLAAAAAMGLRGDEVAMVGDSAADVAAGRAAGAFVALVGASSESAPGSDVVLATIGDLVDHL